MTSEQAVKVLRRYAFDERLIATALSGIARAVVLKGADELDEIADAAQRHFPKDGEI